MTAALPYTLCKSFWIRESLFNAVNVKATCSHLASSDPFKTHLELFLEALTKIYTLSFLFFAAADFGIGSFGSGLLYCMKNNEIKMRWID